MTSSTSDLVERLRWLGNPVDNDPHAPQGYQTASGAELLVKTLREAANRIERLENECIQRHADYQKLENDYCGKLNELEDVKARALEAEVAKLRAVVEAASTTRMNFDLPDGHPLTVALAALDASGDGTGEGKDPPKASLDWRDQKG